MKISDDLAVQLVIGIANEGLVAEDIQVKSTVSLEPKDGGFAITQIHLDVVAVIPGMSAETFQTVAEATKQGCPVSKVLTGADITMSARLG